MKFRIPTQSLREALDQTDGLRKTTGNISPDHLTIAAKGPDSHDPARLIITSSDGNIYRMSWQPATVTQEGTIAISRRAIEGFCMTAGQKVAGVFSGNELKLTSDNNSLTARRIIGAEVTYPTSKRQIMCIVDADDVRAIRLACRIENKSSTHHAVAIGMESQRNGAGITVAAAANTYGMCHGGVEGQQWHVDSTALAGSNLGEDVLIHMGERLEIYGDCWAESISLSTAPFRDPTPIIQAALTNEVKATITVQREDIEKAFRSILHSMKDDAAFFPGLLNFSLTTLEVSGSDVTADAVCAVDVQTTKGLPEWSAKVSLNQMQMLVSQMADEICINYCGPGRPLILTDINQITAVAVMPIKEA